MNDPKCPRIRRAPGAKLGTTRAAPCTGTIADWEGRGPECNICHYKFSAEETEAVARASARKPDAPKRHTAQQLSMLADIV